MFFFFLMIRRPPRSTLFPTRRSSDLRELRSGRGDAPAAGLAHEAHVSGEVGDRPDATLLAEPDATRVAANGQRLGQLARIEVEDLHHPRTRNGHISLPVVRRHADAECLARERD